MQNTTQKTNQRMPGRSADVIGNELGNGPVGATPSVNPKDEKAPVKKKADKSAPNAAHH